MMSEPHDQEMLFNCEAQHEWREIWILPMNLTTFAARLKTAQCPYCFSKKVFLGWGESRPSPSLTAIREVINETT
jgi:hypothetical protein